MAAFLRSRFLPIMAKVSLRFPSALTTVSMSIPSNAHMYDTLCKFHSSSPAYLAKPKKGGNSKTDEPVVAVTMPKPKDFETQMDKRILRLVEEFDKIRGGKPSADMLNHVMVSDAESGSRTPIGDTSQITLKQSNKLTINPFDPSMISR